MWTDPARHHLFYETNIVADKKEYVTGKLFAKLREILDKGLAIHPHIKRLSLCADPSMNQILAPELLRDCYTHLTSLHTLLIKGTRFRLPCAGDPNGVSIAPRIHTFEVISSTIDDGFLATVGQMGSLHTLIMKDINRYTMKLNSARFRPPPLASLQFIDATDPLTLKHFLALENVPSLESLTVTFRARPTKDIMEDLKLACNQTGGKLSHLSLRFDYSCMSFYFTAIACIFLIEILLDFSPNFPLDASGLGPLSTLTSFSVSFDLTSSYWTLNPQDENPELHWGRTLPLVLPKTHETILHLEIGIFLESESLRSLTRRMKSWDWATLRSTLTHWDALETITFWQRDVNSGKYVLEWEGMVRGHLAALTNCRILFRYNEDAEVRQVILLNPNMYIHKTNSILYRLSSGCEPMLQVRWNNA